jgi:hypothetical protein
MYVCQWHLEIPFGTQSEAVRIINAWGRDKMAHSEFRRARDLRLMAGHIGASPSHLVDEYVFDSLADFEAAGDSDVLHKVAKDLQGKGITEQQIRAKMDELLDTAIEQVKKSG